MATEERRPYWRSAIVGLLGAAVLAGLVGTLTSGGGGPLTSAGGPPGRAAAAEPGVDEMPAAAVPVVTFIGNSWTEGIGATARHGYALRTAERLGWEPHVLGVAGSGYLQPGRGDPFDERIERAVATDPDVLVLQGSLDDAGSPPDELHPAAVETLSSLRAAIGPGTVVLVMGSAYTPGTDPAAIDDVNEVVAAAAARVGFAFVDPAAENWNDPAVPGIWADANHPDDTGHQLLATRLAPVLASLLER